MKRMLGFIFRWRVNTHSFVFTEDRKLGGGTPISVAHTKATSWVSQTQSREAINLAEGSTLVVSMW